MRSRTTRRFRLLLEALGQETRQQARDAYRLFAQNPFHPGLRLKELRGKSPYWSVRIGRHVRAVGLRQGNQITWFWIGSHADFDRLVERL